MVHALSQQRISIAQYRTTAVSEAAAGMYRAAAHCTMQAVIMPLYCPTCSDDDSPQAHPPPALRLVAVSALTSHTHLAILGSVMEGVRHCVLRDSIVAAARRLSCITIPWCSHPATSRWSLTNVTEFTTHTHFPFHVWSFLSISVCVGDDEM